MVVELDSAKVDAMIGERTVERFWQKVEANPETGCWLWVGAKNSYGYGHFWVGGKVVRAHRFSWELMNGSIPAGLDLDHLCRVRHCVNPEHLEPVDRRTNLLRGNTLTAAEAAKTECPQGHPYDEANTHRGTDGSRHCRACDSLRHRERRRRLASASSGGVRDR